jgi:hypothetical protein
VKSTVELCDRVGFRLGVLYLLFVGELEGIYVQGQLMV